MLMGESWEWRTVNETKRMIQVKHYGSSIDLMKSLKVEAVHMNHYSHMYMYTIYNVHIIM